MVANTPISLDTMFASEVRMGESVVLSALICAVVGSSVHSKNVKCSRLLHFVLKQKTVVADIALHCICDEPKVKIQIGNRGWTKFRMIVFFCLFVVLCGNCSNYTR